MTRLVRLVVVALFALSMPAIAADTLVVVVRHAEKAGDDPRDPALSEAGRARAQALARHLDGMTLAAAYATDYRRTRLTAQPSAEAAGIEVRGYEASGATLPDTLRKEHSGQTVLVVGHSNTVPAIVQALSGREVAPIADEQYDRLYLIALPETGPPRLLEARY